MTEETLLEFPCEFPIKVMGRADEQFSILVTEIVSRHYPELTEDAIREASSKAGRFVSLTVTITATSKAQLDSIYQELTDREEVLMAL